MIRERRVVSICMITYNHEKYIYEAIESVLMQKLQGNFELVIGEDYSTDKTRMICEKYAEKYPEIIKLLPSEKNLGVIPNFIRTLQACTGIYIALCEGDDYWTDPCKLQKQVDFLETNKDCGLVHTDLDMYFQNSEIFKSNFHFNNPSVCHGYLFESLLIDNSIATLTVMFRSEYMKKISFDQMSQYRMGDIYIWLEIAKHSRIGFINESMAVYRVHSDSASNHNGGSNRIEFISSAYNLNYFFINKYGCSLETKKRVYRKALDTGYSMNALSIFNDGFIRLKEAGLATANDMVKYILINLRFVYYLKKVLIGIRKKTERK